MKEQGIECKVQVREEMTVVAKPFVSLPSDFDVFQKLRLLRKWYADSAYVGAQFPADKEDDLEAHLNDVGESIFAEINLETIGECEAACLYRLIEDMHIVAKNARILLTGDMAEMFEAEGIDRGFLDDLFEKGMDYAESYHRKSVPSLEKG